MKATLLAMKKREVRHEGEKRPDFVVLFLSLITHIHFSLYKKNKILKHYTELGIRVFFQVSLLGLSIKKASSGYYLFEFFVHITV